MDRMDRTQVIAVAMVGLVGTAPVQTSRGVKSFWVAIITATVVLEAVGVPMVMAAAGAEGSRVELEKTKTKIVKQ